MIFFGCLFYLFLYLSGLAYFDMAPQGDASRFLYLEAQSLYIHYATLLSADICLQIKTMGASFFLVFFFWRQHTYAWLRTTRIVGCVSGLFFLFFFIAKQLTYTCAIFEVCPSGASGNESNFST